MHPKHVLLSFSFLFNYSSCCNPNLNSFFEAKLFAKKYYNDMREHKKAKYIKTFLDSMYPIEPQLPELGDFKIPPGKLLLINKL